MGGGVTGVENTNERKGFYAQCMVRRNAKHNIEKRNSILNLTDTAEGDMGDVSDSG